MAKEERFLSGTSDRLDESADFVVVAHEMKVKSPVGEFFENEPDL
jgi:hypothetical protein